MSIVFVTGGSGFIGSHLIRRLVARGDTVRALSRSDRSDHQLHELGAEPVRGSLGDVESLAAAMAGADLVFHVAARTSGGTREQFWSDNVTGTAHVIAAARRSTARRLVHVGTEAALMAGRPLVQVDETAPLCPDSRARMQRQRPLPNSSSATPTAPISRRSFCGRGSCGETVTPRFFPASSTRSVRAASPGSVAAGS